MTHHFELECNKKKAYFLYEEQQNIFNNLIDEIYF